MYGYDNKKYFEWSAKQKTKLSVTGFHMIPN
jgi:hypothetical protein